MKQKPLHDLQNRERMTDRMPLPYVPNTEADRKAMLRDIGVESVDELFRDIPEEFRNPEFSLPPRLSELELKKELGGLAGSNVSLDDYACFLGAGSYRHFIPSVVDHIVGRSEFYTAYTPYQAEVSQGTLQSVYEFQSLICQLTGMEVSNAGMYDGSTSAAEAAMMACAMKNRSTVAVLASVNPTYREVLDTYCRGKDLPLVTIESDEDSLPADCACLIIQQPNFFGHFEPIESYVSKAHDVGALLIDIVDPISLGIYRPPGDHDVDIVVGEGQVTRHTREPRWALSGSLCLPEGLRSTDAGQDHRQDRGCRWQSGLRHDPGHPRTVHSSRASDI